MTSTAVFEIATGFPIPYYNKNGFTRLCTLTIDTNGIMKASNVIDTGWSQGCMIYIKS